MNIVANNIERIINEKGYKKNAVARRAGISDHKLSDMLGGRAVIRAEIIPNLSTQILRKSRKHKRFRGFFCPNKGPYPFICPLQIRKTPNECFHVGACFAPEIVCMVAVCIERDPDRRVSECL